MKEKYIVFSANWEKEVEAETVNDAVLEATKSAINEKGKSFMISKTVAAVNTKKDVWGFSSVAILEDLGLYSLASQINTYIKNYENANRS